MRLKDQAFFHSMFLSRLADQILLFLVPLVVFQTTGSVSWAGAAFFFETLPRYMAFPVTGILCDRMSPLFLLRASQVGRAGAIFLVLLLHLAWQSTGWLVALSAVAGVLTTQGMMAREVMLPQIFASARFEKVASYTQIADQLGMVMGPLVAGLLLTVASWPAVIAIAGAIFLSADGVLFLWQRKAHINFAPPEQKHARRLGPLLVAFGHVWGLPGLKEIVVITIFFNLIYGLTLATSAAMFTGLHHGTESGYAALQAVGALATVAVLFLTAHSALRIFTLGILSFALVMCGAMLTGFSSGPISYGLGFLMIVGFDKMFSVVVRTVRQRIIPTRDLGKTIGVIVMLHNLSQPLAGLIVMCVDSTARLPQVIVVLTIISAICGSAVMVANFRIITSSMDQ